MNISIAPEDLYARGGLLVELVEKCFDAALIVDSELKIIYISSYGAHFSGASQEELIGTTIDDEPRRTRFRQVIDSGVSLPSQLIEIFDRISVLTILPIVWEGRTLGAFGMIVHKTLDEIRRILSIISKNDDNIDPLSYDKLSRLASTATTGDYIGQSPIVKDMLRKCATVAKSPYPVLILGETGTGKELVANILHTLGVAVPFSPYVSINCTAIPEALLESELFGHVKGAFTGATANRKGKFELAAGGTLMLDEIGDMAVGLQSKLLRALENKEFERVGDTSLIPLQARIISSTNCDILERCAGGSFRPDLYYRLSTFEIHVPPLRERLEDIPLLVKHFIRQERLDVSFTDSAMDALTQYRWPGNVRQLRNIVLRLGVENLGEEISADMARSVLQRPSDRVADTGIALKPLRQNSEYEAALSALEQWGYNVSKAARHLNISRTTLYKRMAQYGIKPN